MFLQIFFQRFYFQQTLNGQRENNGNLNYLYTKILFFMFEVMFSCYHVARPAIANSSQLHYTSKRQYSVYTVLSFACIMQINCIN